MNLTPKEEAWKADWIGRRRERGAIDARPETSFARDAGLIGDQKPVVGLWWKNSDQKPTRVRRRPTIRSSATNGRTGSVARRNTPPPHDERTHFDWMDPFSPGVVGWISYTREVSWRSFLESFSGAAVEWVDFETTLNNVALYTEPVHVPGPRYYAIDLKRLQQVFEPYSIPVFVNEAT